MNAARTPCRARLAAAATLALALVSACAGLSKQQQLEAVARDWAMVIRASQVIPVYPLTEDVQPGDVFLVQVPIDLQQEIYARRGFLPLDNHVARLHPSGYREFYDHSFARGPDLVLPGDYQRPGGKPDGAWATAPHASFPTYSFSVRRGAGLNLAVPISAVPVGLSLLGTDAADGSVSIRNARTLGVDLLSLYQQAQAWAFEHRDFLANFAPSAGRTNYLRIVTRVYVTGELDVALSSAESFAGGVDAGAAKPVELIAARPPREGEEPPAATVESYARNIATLNEALKKLTPDVAGGSLRVTAAGSRSISLSEAFDPPLVLGYLGFDVPIAAGGELGRPVPTHAVIDRAVGATDLLSSSPIARLYRGSVNRTVYEALKGIASEPQARERVAALDALAAFVPDTATVYEDRRGRVGERVLAHDDLHTGEGGYLDFLAYRGALRNSERVLARYLAKPPFDLVAADGTTVRVEDAGEAHERLRAARAAASAADDDPVTAAAERAASQAALQLYRSLDAEDDGDE